MLGRIVGFGGVVLAVVLVMGVAGYVWIQRQIPAEVHDQLTCRVPVYGSLFFLDRTGAPAPTGINTGDVWAFRSYIEGNTPSRAVWLFNNITPEAVGDSLRMESRFEAFRTIKGSEESQDKGVEAQFVLVNNMREEAFGFFSVSSLLADFSEQLRDGQFQNAADSLREFASMLADTPDTIKSADIFRVDERGQYGIGSPEDAGLSGTEPTVRRVDPTGSGVYATGPQRRSDGIPKPERIMSHAGRHAQRSG